MTACQEVSRRSQRSVFRCTTPIGVDLPNVLSFLRLAGVPLVLWLILGPQADGLAVLVLALGGLTDWLDGHLARAWHQTSRIGQMLDPIADRLYILAVLIGLALREIVPWWLVVIIVGRDVFVVVLVPILKTRGYSSLPVHFLGKVATFCLLYAFPLGAARLGPAGLASAGVGDGLGIRNLGHSSLLVRRWPLRSSDRQVSPVHATHPRPQSLQRDPLAGSGTPPLPDDTHLRTAPSASEPARKVWHRNCPRHRRVELRMPAWTC